jgi:ribosomal-protein-alanine N-acetyltransferase
MVTLRPLQARDSDLLAALYRANRDFLAPWEPLRGEEFFTEQGQRRIVEEVLDQHAAGQCQPMIIMVDSLPVGRVTLSGIVRGAFQSTHLGYWVGADHNGLGVASSAVALILELGFGELGLHRVEAGTLVHNKGSQRVLAKNGFERIGLARAYLQIGGQWQDHLLFQRVEVQPD